MSTPKFIVLTGVSRGCGRALAEWFIDHGHIVAGCARSPEPLEELRARCRARPVDRSRFDAVDIADPDATATWAAAVLASHGPPDLIVNNAAVIARNAPLWDVPAHEATAVLSVNIGGTINVIRGFVPAMVSAQHGTIINFSSGWGRSTSPEVAVYCASKFAIEGLTQALAQELPRGMAAIALNPGIIDTEMLRLCFGSGAASYPDPQAWARRAAPYILRLGPKDSGRSVDVPGVPVE